MEDVFKQCLWKNFGATIDMLSSAIALCPDELWETDRKFFYLTYHTTIFLDYYLAHPVKDFHPALPYSLVNPDNLPPEAVDDVIPDRFYSRQEMLVWLTSIREKCKLLITLSTTDQLSERWINDEEIDMHGLCPSIVENYTVLEILFYNFRHVQHHVAQLNFILRQKINNAPDWVSQVD
ncbi:MAG: DinB family protein [Saprospiraceae bacterium]